MKRTKRVVMSIMVLCFVFAGLLTPDRADAASDNDFVIENGVLTKYQGAGGDVVIPNSVTEIGYYAFFNCSKLTSITIPEGVTKIEGSAFSRCSSLTNVTIPSSVTEIGDYAFYVCSKLTKLTIPDGVTKIGEWTFSRCSSLTNVTIPSSVTEIGSNAFSGSYILTSITIPDKVTKIGDCAFFCSGLTSIAIPNSVTEIGDCAFAICDNLKEFTIPKNVTKFGLGVLTGCDSLNKITILNKKVNLIDTFASAKNKNYLSTLFGVISSDNDSSKAQKPTTALTVCGYKYSTADEFAVLLNTLQATGTVFGIKSVKFVPLDKNKDTLDHIKVPTSMTIKKGKAQKLSIQLPSSLKRVEKFTKKQGQVKISITYCKESLVFENSFSYDIRKVSNDTIKATEKGTGYAYTTVTLPNGDKKVFATKVIVK